MKRKKAIKKTLALTVAAVTVTATGVLPVYAAGLKDVFSAKYYASLYPDLQAVFGNDENALYLHFLTYGIKEGRSMSPVLDIVKYREAYGDLNEAFGDNWDAYVEHYFTHGISEKRASGGIFDPVAYAEAYPDVKAAFGDDYSAIIEHYLTHGISEGRTEGVTLTVESAPAAKPASSSNSGSVESTPAPEKPQSAAIKVEASLSNFLGESLAGLTQDGKLTYTVEGTTIKVDGVLKYVTGYTGFSSDTTEQKGYFLPFKVTAEGEVSAQLNKSGQVGNWKTDPDGKNEFIFLLSDNAAGQGKSVNVKVDDTTYTMDFTNLHFQTVEGPDSFKVGSKQMYNKSLTDLVDGDLTWTVDEKNDTITVSGKLKKLTTGWEAAYGQSNNTGYFLPFYVTTLKGPEADKKVTLTSVKGENPKAQDDNASVIRLGDTIPEDANIKITIDGKEYKLDISGLEAEE